MHISKVGSVLLFMGILVSSVHISESRRVTLTLDQGTVVKISRREVTGSKCTVCTGEGRKQSCLSAALLRYNVSAEFTCPQPEDIFTVEIIREIVCTRKFCNGDIMPTDYPPLRDFNRTFTWNLTAPVPLPFRVDFTRTGLKQIRPTESCPDKHTYSLVAFERPGTATVGTFCRQGTITGAQVLNGGSMSLEVPGKTRLDAATFSVSVGQEIKSLAVINVTLSEEILSAEFFSPNYPDSFPDDDLMTWDFHVLPKYYATVSFLGHTEPRCLKKDPGVEYQRVTSASTSTVVKRLSDPQPAEQQGPFTLSLRNCEMDLRQARSSKLSLHFRVSALRRGSEVKCKVDLSEKEGLSIHIERKKSGSDCVLKQDSVVQDNITVSSGRVSQLSFLDCQEKDLLLTVDKIIECQQWKGCPKAVSLTVPALDKHTCLPKSLRQVRWHLRAPEDGSVELLSPTGSLRQSLPDQWCNSSVLAVAEDNGAAIGEFCPQGAIRKIQIKANVTITASLTAGTDLSRTSKPVLNISFSKHIAENYIFTVSPKKGSPTVLATPSWPSGMKSYHTVCWIVSLPPKLEAHLHFTNIKQPKCSNRHTGIKVQTLGSLEEMFSRREDEEAESEIVVRESFYLNMSNCMAERGAFSVLSQITLQKHRNVLLTIILSVVGVLLLLMVVVLAMVCLVIRKKKRKMAPQVSIYNPNGQVFLPGLHGVPKSQEDDDSHIYDYIEDTLVYGHLLQDEMEMDRRRGPAVDVYRAFTGPMEGKPLTAHTETGDPEVGVYRPFVGPTESVPPVPKRPAGHEDNLVSKDPQMIDNELYTLKGNGNASPPPQSPSQAVEDDQGKGPGHVTRL